MELRLGQILIEQGVLTGVQVDQILAQQQQSGEPFGLLCERMFSIDPAIIERAWSVQYASMTRTVDPAFEVFDPRAVELVTRRQAWQFRILPIRFDENELMIATTQRHLRRALRFAINVIGIPVYFVMAGPETLGAGLCQHYPLPGMTPASVDDDALDHLLGLRTHKAVA